MDTFDSQHPLLQQPESTATNENFQISQHSNPQMMSMDQTISQYSENINLSSQSTTNMEPPSESSSCSSHNQQKKQKVLSIRGKPKSGRTWKSLQKPARKSVVIPALRSKSWQEKLKQREQHKAMKALEQQLRERKEEKRRQQLERIKQRQKQREENAFKSSTYQEIKNTAKIKKMSRKQLRNIRKLADINKY